MICSQNFHRQLFSIKSNDCYLVNEGETNKVQNSQNLPLLKKSVIFAIYFIVNGIA